MSMDRRNPQTAGRMESFQAFGASRPPETVRPERRHAARLSSPGRELVSATSLSGEHVLTRRGEPIGNVSELMLDVQRGRIAYAVVAHGGFMGIGERLHAIPWRALHAEGDCLVLDAERSTFLAAPGFDKEHWPHTPDAAWHHALHRHYRCRPYWE
jgi:sporulation protein YlmC with PRC-barrel domain